jgi:methionyl-tRNA formyltransferase
MLKEKKGVEITAVFAPVEDKLFKLVRSYREPVKEAGTLRVVNIPVGTDLLIAAHSHDFVSAAVRDKLNLGAVGYHPSLLPRHRGRDAVRWAVKVNDPVTGGTVYWLNNTVDGGPIAKQEWCWVKPGDTASSLWRRELFPLGIKLLSEVIDDILAKRLVQRDQDLELATWEPAITGQPRLFRPELLRIGTLPGGYKIEK